MSADILHHGHMNIINHAQEICDEIIIGLHSDEVIQKYWRKPILNYEARELILKNIRGVVKVVKQDSLDMLSNVLAYQPDVIIYGDDYLTGYKKQFHDNLVDWTSTTKQKFEIITVPYTKDVSITQLENMTTSGLPEKRLRSLKDMIYGKGFVKIMEAHNGLTGLIVENAKVEVDGQTRSFDGMWVSSLCDSTAKGKPDTELVDFSSRMSTVNDILDVTTKPIILDGDTGGKIEHFSYLVSTLERLGVSAIIIEDKVGLKKNSLFGTEVAQQQDSIENFCEKIKAGRNARKTPHFMIISRIESLILKQGMDDAKKRCLSYIEAGTDGIMIHSEKKDGLEIIEFCEWYKTVENRVPLILVPSSYNFMTEDALESLGANVVIYANHLLRSAYPAMMDTAKSILDNKTSFYTQCMPIKEILELIPGGK